MTADLSHIDPDILASCSEADKIEYAMVESEEKIDAPLSHVFTPGLYARTIFMPAGSLVMSMTHKTRHPFVITTGEVDVITPDGVFTHIAPYMGITQPGTKRFLRVKKDTTWTTFHANPENLTDPDEIGEVILDEPANPLLDPEDPRCNSWKRCLSNSITVNAIGDVMEIQESQNNLEGEQQKCRGQ
jgi:hypothetical protein